MPNNNPDFLYPEKLLFQFREKGIRPTGRREVAGLRDIDHALGNLIARSLQGLFVTTETVHNRSLARFLERPPQDQVLLGHFEDLRDMVRAIRQARAGRGSQKGNKYANLDALPIINLTRTLDISYGYSERQLDRSDFGELVNSETGVTSYAISSLPMQLSYILTVVTAEKEPLAILCNALANNFYFMHSTSFNAPTSLCGQLIDVECALNNMKGFMVSDISLPVSEERLFAGQMTIDVIADNLVAHEVESFTRRTQVGIKVMEEVRPFPGKDI